MVRTVPVGACGGRGCSAEDTEITLVYSEARFRDDPDAGNVSAWLCQACLVRLRGAVRPIDLTSTREPRDEYLYRGKPVPGF